MIRKIIDGTFGRSRRGFASRPSSPGHPQHLSKRHGNEPLSKQPFDECIIANALIDGMIGDNCLDAGLTMHAVMNAIIGAQRRLASLGNKVEQEYGNSIDHLFRETIRIILLGLCAPETPNRPHPRKANIRKGTGKRPS